MSTFEVSGQELGAAGRRFAEVADQLAGIPIHDLMVGDVGSVEVADALRAFQASWSAYARRRSEATLAASGTLDGVANDVARADELIAQRAARLGRS
jgi:hypothetical protein